MSHGVTFVLAAMLVPASVYAQAAPASSGINRTALPTVFVLDERGVETRGKLLKLDDKDVVLLVGDEERRFDTRTVARVAKRGDSLKNGAVAGLVKGLLLGAVTSGVAECEQDGHYQGCGAGTRVAFTAMSGGIYAAMGTAIDAAFQGRTTLYEAPRPPKSAVSARGASFALRLRW